MSKDYAKWIKFAEGDLGTAKTIFKHSKTIADYRNICFLCQQSVEKGIKSVLYFLEIDFPYIHDIYVLFTLLEEKGYFLKEEVKKSGYLTQYATKKRYPDDAFDFTKKDAREAIDNAKLALKWAKKVTKDKNLLLK